MDVQAAQTSLVGRRSEGRYRRGAPGRWQEVYASSEPCMVEGRASGEAKTGRQGKSKGRSERHSRAFPSLLHVFTVLFCIALAFFVRVVSQAVHSDTRLDSSDVTQSNPYASSTHLPRCRRVREKKEKRKKKKEKRKKKQTNKQTKNKKLKIT
jgi:hypothetical protein